MNIDERDLENNFSDQLDYFRENKQFDKIAGLLAYVLKNNLYGRTSRIFGYVPGIFPEIEIHDPARITTSDLCIGEPVVYKIHFGSGRKLYGFPFFYLFCYFKDNPARLNVFFQSAHPDVKNLTAEDYSLAAGTIRFGGCLTAFNDSDISVISVCDPGHFVHGLESSYYAGSREMNFNREIAMVLETLCNLAGVSFNQVLLFGSSAGAMGALLGSTYFRSKVNVMAVNNHVSVLKYDKIMTALFGMDDPEQLAEQYGSQLSCMHRFRQELSIVPNIYLLANVNDELYQKNWEFYCLYRERFSGAGMKNQSVFDSYVGIDGHGFPARAALRAKIRIAREVLTMDASRGQWGQ